MCLMCSNVFRSKYKHLQTREEMLNDMRADKDKLDTFFSHRRANVERLKRGSSIRAHTVAHHLAVRPSS